MHVVIPTLESVHIAVEGAIGTLMLNRPEALNAFNHRLMEDIIEAVKWFDRQSDVKVVVIKGKGRAFCAGFDLNYFSAAASSKEVSEIVALGHTLAQTVSRMRATTIAEVHGHCIGGGVVLLAACDFRYASPDATFLLPETQLGIPLAWGGIPWLVREIGPLMTTEFVLLCDPISSDRALRMGMLNSVVPADVLQDHVHAIAQQLCERSRLVLELTKQQVIAARDEMVSNNYSFGDAHLLHCALLDNESIQAKNNYLNYQSERRQAQLA